MRHVVDGVLLQKLRRDHPGRAAHNLVHPPECQKNMACDQPGGGGVCYLQEGNAMIKMTFEHRR